MSEGKGGSGIKKFEAGFGPTGEALPEVPLRVVVLSELTPRDLRTGKSVEHRRLIRIDRESFDEAMAGLSLRAFLDVPDRLSGSSKPIVVEVALRDMKAFRPDAVAAQIPATRDLVQLRSALADLRSGKTTLAEVRGVLASARTPSAVAESVRRALEGPAPAAAPAPSSAAPGGPPAAAGDLDALLGMVDAPEGAAASARGADLSRLDALVRHLVASDRRGERVDGRAVEAAAREVDAAISAQVDEVLHHPEFRRLEAAWRGLRFLTDRTDFRDRPVAVEVVASGRDALLSAFDDLVLGPETQGLSSQPVSFIVVDMTFDRSADDLELLAALAERGSSLQAPVLTSVGPSFLGLQAASELARRPGIKEAFASPEAAKWEGLRKADPSRWLGVVFNRFLLRPAYAPGENAARTFDYTERPAGEDGVRVWGNPGWALAVLATRSYTRIGWCTDIMGQRASGMVDDLPVRPYVRPGAEPVAFPLETVISDEVERDLSVGGVMALSGPLGGDRAYLRFAPTAHAPQFYQDPTDRARAKLQSTLPFQMFVSRLLNYAMLVERSLVPGRTEPQITSGYDRALRSLLGTAGAVPPDAVNVSLQPNEADPSRRDLCIRVRWPGFQSLPGAGDVEFRWPVSP
jgi:type VI secretion system protein ImpC